jgi:ankyrin repeat protein
MDANANQAKRSGRTPLIVAAYESNLAVVHCLVVELGADVKSTNPICWIE